MKEFHCSCWESNPDRSDESQIRWPLHYHCLDENRWINGPLHASQAFSFDDFLAAASPGPLTSDLQPLTKWHWKIAGRRPAIFNGTPGKFEAIILGQPHWGHFWPLTSYWGIKMLKQQKKSICAAFERLLIRWSKLSAYSLSWENLHFPRSGLSSLGLTVQPRPPASAGQLSDLGWTVQISENENSIATKKLRYRALSPLSSPSNAAQNIYSQLSHLWF